MCKFVFTVREQFGIFEVLLFGFSTAYGVVFWINNFGMTLVVGVVEVYLLIWLLGYLSIFRNSFYEVLSGISWIEQALKLLVSTAGGNERGVCLHVGVTVGLGLFVVFFNLLGLVPLGICVTSQLTATQCLGVFTVGGLFLKGVEAFGFRWLNLFLPSNVPVAMVVFLLLIDVISYCSRMISLSVRLFANMVAGHSLLHILMGSGLTVLNLLSWFGSFWGFVLFLLTTSFILLIMTLETGIAFLQSYVFVVLYSIYMSEFSEAIAGSKRAPEKIQRWWVHASRLDPKLNPYLYRNQFPYCGLILKYI